MSADSLTCHSVAAKRKQVLYTLVVSDRADAEEKEKEEEGHV
jgi:hypothetical protein